MAQNPQAHQVDKKELSRWERIKKAVANLLKRVGGEYRYWKESGAKSRTGTYATYGITPCIAAQMKMGMSRDEAVKRCQAVKGGKQ